MDECPPFLIAEKTGSFGISVEGMQFVVTGKDDVVILKAISEPSLDEFESLIQEARAQAKQARLKKSDIKNAMTKARGRK